jgi:hypothetical protein
MDASKTYFSSPASTASGLVTWGEEVWRLRPADASAQQIEIETVIQLQNALLRPLQMVVELPPN